MWWWGEGLALSTIAHTSSVQIVVFMYMNIVQTGTPYKNQLGNLHRKLLCRTLNLNIAYFVKDFVFMVYIWTQVVGLQIWKYGNLLL